MKIMNSLFVFNLNDEDREVYALQKSVWQQKLVELLMQKDWQLPIVVVPVIIFEVIVLCFSNL